MRVHGGGLVKGPGLPRTIIIIIIIITIGI